MSGPAADPQSSSSRSIEVLIVGAGFGGIAAAIELRQHGITDITILEKAPDLGGTWFYNSYPGAACDVPSHLYSFSYAQRRDWSRLCSPQAEIHAYLHDVARSYGIDRLVQTSTTVTSCSWDAERCRWSVHSADGAVHEADALILATGQLDQPSRPRIEGADGFAGHSFHSAVWDHDYPLAGKRVAVVGTGASAVQFVPEIARVVERLSVFQRTGNWFMPRHNRSYNAAIKAAIARIPGLQALRRRFVFEYTESLTLAIRHPNGFGRIARAALGSLHALAAEGPGRARARHGRTTRSAASASSSAPTTCPRCSAQTSSSSPTRSRASPPRGSSPPTAREHELDCVIWATGFKTTDFMFPMRVSGSGGVELREYWSERSARPPRDVRARLPEHVRDVRAQHEHLGRLDHRLPGGAGRLHPPGPAAAAQPRRRRDRGARRGRGRHRPRAAGALRRHGVDASATPGTATSTAASSRTGPATCASTSQQTGQLDPAEYSFAPAAKPATVVSA